MRGKKFFVAAAVSFVMCALHLSGQSVVKNQVENQLGVTQVFGALWQEGGGQSSALLLRNAGPSEQATINTAEVVLYAQDGRQERVAQLNVKGRSVTRLALKDLVQSTEGVVHWGGLAVQSSRPIQGQLVIEDGRGGIRYIALQAGDGFDTENTLHTSWWLPDNGSQGLLTLFNSSDQTVVVTPSVATQGMAGNEPSIGGVALAPHGSAKLDLTRDLLGKNGTSPAIGSLILRYTGPAHALQPSLSIANPATGFLLQPGFQAKHGGAASAGAATWQFPAVFVADAKQTGADTGEAMAAYALLSNATKAPMQPELTAYFSKTDGQAANQLALPIDVLQPGEVRLLNLSQLVAQGGIFSGLVHMALTISHSGSPGDLGVTVLAANQSKSIIQSSAGIVRPSGATDTGFWDVSVHPPVLPKIQNSLEGQASLPMQAILYYADSWGVAAYELPTMDVRAGRASNTGLALRSAMLSGIPDGHGNTIPSNSKFGLVAVGPVQESAGDKLAQSSHLGLSRSFSQPGTIGDAGAAAKITLALAMRSGAPAACGPPPPPPPTPDHLKIVSDTISSISSCPTTKIRRINYDPVNASNVSVGSVSTHEQFTSKGTNTCGNGTPKTTDSCVTVTTAQFVDALRVGCNTVGGSCGFTFTNQQWVWCKPAGGTQVLATVGDLIIHNDSISVGGTTSTRSAGTCVYPDGSYANPCH